MATSKLEQPTAPKPVGRPRRLAREDILKGAMEIIDRHGATRLSVRALASHLGVQHTAIYTHFVGIEAIEEAVLERLWLDVPLPSADSPIPFRDQLIDYFVALRSAHVLHPEISTGKVGSRPWVQNAVRVNSVLEQFARRGIDGATAEIAYFALIGVTVASAMIANANRASTGADDPAKIAKALKDAGATHLIALARETRTRVKG